MWDMSLSWQRGRRWCLGALATGLALLVAGGARAAWVDARLIGSDTRLVVESDGTASVDLTLGVRVAAGTLHRVDLAGLHADAFDAAAEVLAEDGATAGASVAQDEKGVHVGFEGKGLSRGAWTVHLRGTTRFGADRGLTADGPLWRLVWTSAVASDGLDGARVVFDLPAGPTAPAAVDGEWADGPRDLHPDARGALVTLRRHSGRDELELVRPHVGRGEAASWAARVDPGAFPALIDAPLRPASAAGPTRSAPPTPWGLVLLAAFVGVVFAALVGTKARAARAYDARPAIALPAALDALGAGSALALAVWLEIQGKATLAALAVAGAVAFATFVACEPKPIARGVWLALRGDEVFARAPWDPFDPWNRAGRVAVLLGVIGLVALARLLALADDRAPMWVALDTAALVPLFATGVRAGRPPGPARDAAILEPLATALEREHKVVPWARAAVEDGAPRELRLLVVPRPPLPGLVAFEIGVGWLASGRAWAPRVELLVRVRAQSAAHARLLSGAVARPAAAEPGAKQDERVLRWVFEPDQASRGARSLAAAVRERREGPSAVGHAERRRDRVAPVSARAAASIAAPCVSG